MAFHAIAYGPDEHCLMTIDRDELLAHDAQTEGPKWRLTLPKPLLGVFFVNPTALPGCQGANPFRSQSSAGRAILVVDVEGRLSVVDASLGQALGELGPFGKPYAVATSGASTTVALALDDTLVLWRNTERSEIAVRARALAFSTDGATLAVGTDKGELRMYYIAPSDTKAPPEQTYRAELRHGTIADITQHPNGTWVVATANGVLGVTPSGPAPLGNISAGVHRVQLDANGERLAVQRSDKAIVVYEYPKLSVLMRIEYTDRPVRGIAFGPENWLGVALDHGDGNKIDIVTTSVHRTDTHPGRDHRSWTLLVEGKKDILSAKEAEDIRRMKSPFEPEKTASSSSGFGGAGGRIGIGAMISIALIGLRVCVRTSSSSSPSSFNYNIPTMPTLPTRCDRACATERMQQLKTECITAELGCEDDVSAAQAALAAGKCSEAKSALARTSSKVGSGKSALFGSYQLLATMGLSEACTSDSSIRPRVVTHAQVVHLKGPSLEPTIARIPESASPEQGETPRALYAAPDGTLFVATTTAPTSTQDKWAVYRRKKAQATWDVIYKKLTSHQIGRVSLFGRSASDVYVAADITFAHYDGTTWSDIDTPVATLFSVSGNAQDVMMAGGDTSTRQIHRRRKGDTGGASAWTKEPMPEGVLVNDLFAGSWALAEDTDTSNDIILQRATAAGASYGIWTITTPMSDGGGSRNIRSMWVSPSGDAFVAADESILVSSNNGRTWKDYELEDPMQCVWGRSSTDVYACTTSGGLVHFDGKKWSPAAPAYAGRTDILAMGGTANELLLLTTGEGQAAPH